ncbi:MAG TPA: four helix bundle protein [Spirochaetota bacterium]|nr:four helix bundle protein [Spirochaetota bacterium]
MSELIVYQKAYSLLLDVFARTDGFPKSKRFSLGQRLESRLLDMITMLHGYRYVRNKVARAVEISACFDEVKLLLKIAHDAKIISRPAFAHLVVRTDEIGRMLGGLSKKSVETDK